MAGIAAPPDLPGCVAIFDAPAGSVTLFDAPAGSLALFDQACD
jgi:hypothetical protein